MATVRSISDLLYLFREGQAPKSITAVQFQDLITSLHPATGNFQDLPIAPAGLSAGRLYLSGDTVQIALGNIPNNVAAQFAGAGVASLTASVRARRAARATLGGAGGITAVSTGAFLFEDVFNALSLNNIYGPTPGTWYPSQYYAPDYAGMAISAKTWVLNPFNPATPITGSYAVSGGNLRLLMQNTPAPYLTACASRQYIGQQLVATNVATFGRFEARLSIPAINGTKCAFYLISNSGGGSPVTTEINLEMVTSSAWSPRTQWQFAVPPPGYPSGVPAVAEWHSYYPGAPIIDVTAMNTFAFEMRPTYVACEVNGQEVMRVAAPTEFGHAPWNIYLLQIDGADWTGPLDASPVFTPMLVDYVRVTA